jgi:hypothetical protein
MPCSACPKPARRGEWRANPFGVRHDPFLPQGFDSLGQALEKTLKERLATGRINDGASSRNTVDL